MSRHTRRSLTLAFVLSVLLIVAPPHPAAAAPPPAPSAAATGAAGICALTDVVRTDGRRCRGNHRVRRQILGLPSPLHLINPGNVISKVAGGVATNAVGAVALAVLGGWVASGAESALKDTATVIGSSTKPQLTSSWFSASYWKIAAIAALLTLPFLCAAAVHALVRSDLSLLTRAAFGYLPLSLLAVGIASQLTMLLLSATDEMSSIVSTASGNADAVFLARTGIGAIAASIGAGDAFVGFLAAIVTVAAALALWVELLVREAAVYVIVLMLPLFFAAMVWPARRALTTRAVETLIALILSKFAVVAVLTLGGAALGHALVPGPAAMLTGATLVLLAAFSPWALLRILPLHEVASAAAGGLRSELKQGVRSVVDTADEIATRTIGLGSDGAGWLRPRLASGTHSALDGSRYRDAHRSASPLDVDSGAAEEGVVEQAPAAAGEGETGAATIASGGVVPTGVDNDATRGGGGPTGAGDDATTGGAAGRETARRGPDGVTFPYALGPDDPPLVFNEELAALADLAAANAASRHRAPAADSLEVGPNEVVESPPVAAREPVVESPPLAADDPIAPAPPEHDPIIGPPAPPPPARDLTRSTDDNDEPVG